MFEEDVLLDSQCLAGLLSRGAAIACVDHQQSIDIVIEVLMPDKASKNKRYSIHSHRIVVIVIQVKSGQKYGRIPHWYLCDAMPNWLKKHKGPSAVFSIVFALAAKEPTIKFQEPKGQDKPCYIWCAGISPEVLPQVLDAQQGAWDGILRASRPWEKHF